MVIRCCNGAVAIGDEFDVDFAASTTCHGMKRFCNSWHLARRVFWVFITLMSMLLLAQQLADRFNNFLKFELKTEISSMSAKSLPLPTVTVCNLNLFTKSLLGPMDNLLLHNISMKLSKDVNEHYWSSLSPYNDKIANWSSSDYWKLVRTYEEHEQEILHDYGEASFSVDKWIIRTGWQMKDRSRNASSLLSCRVGRTTCNYEDFKQILTPQGLCYSLNYKLPQIHQKMPGGEGGINIILDIKQDDYTHYTLNGESGQYECGGKIVISDWYDYADLSMGIGVAPGFLGLISTRQVRRATINHPPWGRCEPGPTSTGFPYSVRQCHAECVARHSVEACGCRLWYEPPLDHKPVPVCGVARSTACLILKTLPEEENVEEECIKSCLDACQSTSYSVAASYTLMATNNTISAFVDYLKTLTGLIYTETQVLRNIIAVQIAYPELIVETMSSTQAQSVSSFLGDIGGQLGLFAGISLVTFIELIEYPILKIFSIFSKRRRHSHLSYPIGTARLSVLEAGVRSMGILSSGLRPSNGNGKASGGNKARLVGSNPRLDDSSGPSFAVTPRKSSTVYQIYDCKTK